jgi:DNA repair protein RecO (recombination protein O)
MNAYYGTEALLLSSREWSEADRLLVLFTKELGRINAVAKGVRLSKSKLRGHLNLFSRVRVVVTPGKEYWRLLDAEILPTDAKPNNVQYTKALAVFLERLVTERDADFGIWQCVEGFSKISSLGEFLFAKIKILSELGFLPEGSTLGLFFGPPAIQFIKGEGDDSFLANLAERSAFENGIERILATNHVV